MILFTLQAGEHRGFGEKWVAMAGSRRAALGEVGGDEWPADVRP
jgi:hypothetical protein